MQVNCELGTDMTAKYQRGQRRVQDALLPTEGVR